MSLYKLKKQYRAPDYDYSSDGYYYVTICAKDRRRLLGKINDGEMRLSLVGGMVAKFWSEIPQHFREVQLDEWVIMPNHLHGIIIIQHDSIVGTGHCPVPTLRKSRFGKVLPRSLSTIIGSFKSAVTKRCRCLGFSYFTWQCRFYDHVIRNERSLAKIRQYIQYNPQKWELDRNNPLNFLTQSRKLVD